MKEAKKVKKTQENFRQCVGDADYSQRATPPWKIWNEYKLDPYKADIVKRVLRTKTPEDEKLDIQKIIHVCEEILRQMDAGEWEKWKK